MKVLELFSGTECISNAFRARGHECFTVDYDLKFPSSLHIDIMDLTAEKVLYMFGHPDIIFSANDCTTFSVAAIGYHRVKDMYTGNLVPKTKKACKADDVNIHTLKLIRELNPHFFFIENPVGGLRKMDYMQGYQGTRPPIVSTASPIGRQRTSSQTTPTPDSCLLVIMETLVMSVLQEAQRMVCKE